MNGECSNCKHGDKLGFMYPCRCCEEYNSFFKAKETPEEEKAKVLKEKALFNKYGDEQ